MNSQSSRSLLAPNIGTKGRLVRGGVGIILIAGAVAAGYAHWALCAGLAVGGLFMLFEALRGWCALRACRIRTPF